MIIELYKITIGESSYYYCNSDEPFTYNGDTYEPASIGRSDMVQGQEINRQDIQIRVPFDSPVAAVYLSDIPDVVAVVTIFRVQGADTADPGVLVFWKGRIAGTRAEGNLVIIECESVFTSMRRAGARARYQAQCRHALYSNTCGVDKSAHAVAGIVSEVDRSLLVIAGADAMPDDFFTGGMIEFDGIFRLIVSHSGTSIRLWRAIPGLESADNVTLYPGCNRTLDVCSERFDNALNYGGFPWLPNSNPFKNVNIF